MAERDIVRVFRGESEIVFVVKGVFVNSKDPVIVFEIGAVGVSLVVPEWVVLADIVFELDTDPEKLVVPVDVLDIDALLVCVGLEVVDLELRADKEYVELRLFIDVPVFVIVIAGVLDWLFDCLAVAVPVTVLTRDLVCVTDLIEDLDVDADPVGLAVPELVLVTFGFVAVTVGLSLGVRVRFDGNVELGEPVDVLDACRVFVTVRLTLMLGLAVAVAVTVLVDILEAVPDDVTVPVLLDVIVLVELTVAVPVLELVVVAVDVRVTAIVLEVRGDLVPLGLAVCVLDAAADLVNEGDAEAVFDCPVVLDDVGETDEVFELVVVDVDVLVRGGVLDR